MKASIFILLLFVFQKNVLAQTAPDLTKYKTLGEKVEAWRIYCNELMADGFAGGDGFPKLVIASKKGIAFSSPDSVKTISMFSLFTGIAYESLKSYDSSIYYLKQAASLAAKAGKLKLEITALSRLDNIYAALRQADLRKQNMDRMVAIADTSTDLLTKELALVALSGYYRDINDYEKTIKYRIKIIDLHKEGMIKDTATFDALNLGYKYSNIAQIFNDIEQYDKAIDYLNQARPYIGDKALKGNEETFYVNFMHAFVGKKNIDSTRHYYNLINEAMVGRDPIYEVLSNANYFMGKYYYAENSIDSALPYILKAKRFGENEDELGPFIRASHLLGKIYFTQGKYKESISQLQPVLNNEFEFDQAEYAELHQSLAQSYAKLGQWDSAYRHFDLYNTINEKLLIASSNKNFADAEGKFQNREKQQQIEKKNIQLAAEKKQRYWLLGALALLGLVAILLIMIYRNKKKMADLLESKNETLAILNTQLEEANRTKAKLFSIIGHDLRSPINQVYQFLKLQQLNPQALNESQKSELSNKIQTATGSLLETMEDLLLWSKTQLNEFKVNFQLVSLLDSVTTCKNLLQLNSDAKNILYRITIEKDCTIQTDPYYLQTIIRNLLQNAVKASPENGEISISIAENDNSLSLFIVNNGSSFTQQDYHQLLRNEEDAKSLSGLGLRLVDELSKKINASVNFSAIATSSTRAALILPKNH